MIRDFRNVALGVGWRTLHNVLHNPSLLIPGIVFPLLNFVAFYGGLSRLRHLSGFDYAPGYAGFQFCFVLLQSAAFGGVFTGFGIARDFEYGFSRRLMLASPRRSGAHRRLRDRCADSLADHRGRSSPPSRSSPGCGSRAESSTSQASTCSP